MKALLSLFIWASLPEPLLLDNWIRINIIPATDSYDTVFLCYYIYKMVFVGPNKKIPMFRVFRPYLDLLVKPRISGFLEKNIILYILKG